MTFLYLIFVAFNIWLSYNLYFPNHYTKSRPYALLVFLGGWWVSELAFFVLALQLFITILFIQAGAVSGFFGSVALLLNLGAGYFCIRHYLSASDTDQVFEDALRSTLGAEYQADISTAVLQKIPQSLSIERLLKPLALDVPEVERLSDIQFDMPNGIRLCLDIYRKHDDEHTELTKKPVLFQIHGGAWTYGLGNKNYQARPLMNHMAKHGWIAVSINYRLSPRATFPDHIIDCKKGLAWVKENIASYGGDPDFIALTGGSAGGHLASLMALSENDKNFQPGFEAIDTSVQACVPFYGVYDFTNAHKLQKNMGLRRLVQKSVFKKRVVDNEEEFKQASPMHRIHKDSPPFLIIQGGADTVVSVEEAACFATNLRDVSVQPVCHVELKGAQHAFDTQVSLRSEHTKHAVHKYLSYVHAQYLAKQ